MQGPDSSLPFLSLPRATWKGRRQRKHEWEEMLLLPRIWLLAARMLWLEKGGGGGGLYRILGEDL